MGVTDVYGNQGSGQLQKYSPFLGFPNYGCSFFIGGAQQRQPAVAS